MISLNPIAILVVSESIGSIISSIINACTPRASIGYGRKIRAHPSLDNSLTSCSRTVLNCDLYSPLILAINIFGWIRDVEFELHGSFANTWLSITLCEGRQKEARNPWCGIICCANSIVS